MFRDEPWKKRKKKTTTEKDQLVGGKLFQKMHTLFKVVQRWVLVEPSHFVKIN